MVHMNGFTDHANGIGQLAGFEFGPYNELDSANTPKPRTSVGLSREQMNLTGGKILDSVIRPGEDFGKQIKILRDSLNTSHKT